MREGPPQIAAPSGVTRHVRSNELTTSMNNESLETNSCSHKIIIVIYFLLRSFDAPIGLAPITVMSIEYCNARTA